jgi:hypothetical protein
MIVLQHQGQLGVAIVEAGIADQAAPMRGELVDVKGRSKPASAGRLKTSHFEETTVRHLDFCPVPALEESLHGESTQDGAHRHDSELT